MADSVNLEMLQKLVLDVQAELKAFRTNTEKGMAGIEKKLDAQSTTLVSIRRDFNKMESEVATLLSAVDDHSRRLTALEKDEHPPARV